MSTLDTLGSRLRVARKAARLTLAEIAKHFDHSEAAIQQWERDKTLPSPEKIVRFVRLTGADLLWVMTGTGQRESVGLKHEPDPSESRNRSIPKVSLQQAASGTAKAKLASNETTVAHFACSASSFSISIPDNSNSPRFEPGDRVVIDPEVPPVPGDMVLGVLAAQPQPLFRKYRLETGARGKLVVLEPLNTDWPREMASPAKIKILGVMTEHTKPRR
jgi:HTH-type transcriptional regulator, cell division transcriptional repressor